MKFSLPKILLPLDFSGKDVGAARYAIQLAKAFGARITLLHVLTQHYGFDMPGFENEGLASFLIENENKAQKGLDSFLKRGFGHLQVKRVLVKGDPAQEIVRYAHSEEASLVIMPTYGHGPFRRRLLGSITAKVLHDVTIPVLTGVHIDKSIYPASGYRPAKSSAQSISVQTARGLFDGRRDWLPGLIPLLLRCTLSRVSIFRAKGTVHRSGPGGRWKRQ